MNMRKLHWARTIRLGLLLVVTLPAVWLTGCRTTPAERQEIRQETRIETRTEERTEERMDRRREALRD